MMNNFQNDTHIITFKISKCHFRCSHIFTTPSLYVYLITSQNLDLKVTSLKVAGYGGATSTLELALQMKITLNIK
jgi:hypothetical protein